MKYAIFIEVLISIDPNKKKVNNIHIPVVLFFMLKFVLLYSTTVKDS